MTAKARTQSPIALFLQWLLFSAFGWWVGLWLGVLLTQNLVGESWLNEDRLLVYATLLTLGLAGGIAQSVALHSVLPDSGRWVKFTLVGHALAMGVALLASLVGLRGEALYDDALMLAGFGAAVGLGQWWLLRQHFPQAGWWVLASAVGWLSFLWLVAAPAGSSHELTVRGALYGLIASLPTGLALAWLSRQGKAFSSH